MGCLPTSTSFYSRWPDFPFFLHYSSWSKVSNLTMVMSFSPFPL
ncbi:hypothetical protein ACMBCN_01640 [Candidatus Liberibacter asiaticus]